MKKGYWILLFVFTQFSFCKAQILGEEFPLYQDAVPNSKNVPDPERVVERGENDRAIFDTAKPTLTIFSPKHPNGKAVIICPGGGYIKTAIDKEGILVAKEFIKDSITSFVLKYRTPNDTTSIDKSIAPLQDAQQAIRFVRKNAQKYKVDPNQVGIMGFSAGGHVAAAAANHFSNLADSNKNDTTSVRPDFVVLIYPIISFTDELVHEFSRIKLLGENPTEEAIDFWSIEKQVTPNSPPAFLVHAADDRSVPVGNSLAYYSACIENGIPVEMHLYPTGGHGFGLYNTTTPDFWMDRLKNWLKTL